RPPPALPAPRRKNTLTTPCLPYDPDRSDHEEGSRVVTVPGLQTVLVVDDDRAAASALGEFLEREGYTVLAAPGGEAALKVLREVEVALVVTDLALPDMDGLACVRAIGRLSPGPDVILVAAHATREAALAAI